jgi:hypothetical protein
VSVGVNAIALCGHRFATGLHAWYDYKQVPHGGAKGGGMPLGYVAMHILAAFLPVFAAGSGVDAWAARYQHEIISRYVQSSGACDQPSLPHRF